MLSFKSFHRRNTIYFVTICCMLFLNQLHLTAEDQEPKKSSVKTPPVFEPFADVVLQVEAEHATILNKKLVYTKARKELTPYSCGSAPNEDWSQGYRAQTSGGKVLCVNNVWKREMIKTSLASIEFQVPVDGEFYIFMKADSWCCPGGLEYSIDNGLKEKFQCGIGDWSWQSLKSKVIKVNSSNQFQMPLKYMLSAGKHKIEILKSNASCSETFLDNLVISRTAKLSERILNQPGGNGYTLFHYAVMNGNLEAANALLDFGVDPNAKSRNFRKQTPLNLAESHQQKEIGRLLLRRGANSEFPLHEAAWIGDVKTVLKIAKVTPEIINNTWRSEETPLHLAVKHGNGDVVRTLLKHGSDIEKKTKWNHWTPFQFALRHKQPEMAKLLISLGAKKANKAGEEN